MFPLSRPRFTVRAGRLSPIVIGSACWMRYVLLCDRHHSGVTKRYRDGDSPMPLRALAGFVTKCQAAS